ncbi:MAG: LppX_LprAFG lipoprotein [Gordonia sp. (in: high G+C Gram-positive bacteria)]
MNKPKKTQSIPRSRAVRVAGAVLSVSAAVALATGCSSSDDSADTSKTTAPSMKETSRTTQPTVSVADAAKLVEQSAQTTRLMQSVNVDLTVSESIQALPMRKVNGSLTSTPSPAAKGNGSFRINGNILDTEFVVVDGELYTKAKGTDEFQNIGEAKKFYDPAVILDRDRGLANILANLQNPKSAGSETIDGVATQKVTGTVEASVLDPVFPSQGDQKLTGALPVTLWIDAKAPYNLVQMTVTVGKGEIKLVTSKWQDPVTVTKP